MLSWDDLQTFLAIARHGTLSGAARALHVQQTTMGRRLAALEQRAGARLLDKTPAGFVLTATGEAIMGNVERIENETLAVERRITGRDVRLEGTVRVTSVEIIAEEILPPALAAFRDTHPGITVELLTDARALSLTRREADIAIRLVPLTQNDLAVRKIGTLATGLYASQTYLDRNGPPDLAAGAPGHTSVLNLAETAVFPEAVWMQAMTHAATPAIRHNSRYGQRQAAEAGLGLVALSRFMGDRGNLVRLETPTPAPKREIWLGVHNDIRHTPRIRAVTDMIAVTLRANARLLDPA